ncbi:N-6 DNA methylase [Vibrio lentus]
MVELNQYYTSETTSALLASMLDATNALNCIELSAGEGALIEPLKNVNSEVKFTTVDIDPINSKKLSSKYPDDIHICGDALNSELDLGEKPFDLAVCNPPFSFVNKQSRFDYLLKDEFEDLFKDNARIRLEVLFILRNMQLLKYNATLAVIVPDLIVTSDRFLSFRSALLSKYHLTGIFECEHYSFKKTEAKTFILFIKKCKPIDNKNTISLTSFKNGKKKSKVVEISKFTHPSKTITGIKSYSIFRGSNTSKQCRETGLDFHHNYSWIDDFSNITYSAVLEKTSGFKYAKPGDILIHRVGRNVGKTVILQKNEVIVSDCIIVLRFLNEKDKNLFIRNWKKNKNEWLFNNTKGTCAKNISITNLNRYLFSLGIH